MLKNLKHNVSVLVTFIALSAIGGIIKMPSPVGSIALDSMPAYFCAGFYGPLVGSIVGAIGHLASAATGGFPLGVLHIAVALQMIAWCGLFGLIVRSVDRKWGVWVAAAIATLLNGVASPLILVLLGLPYAFAVTIIPFLLGASAINIVLASIGILTASRMKVRWL